MLGMFFTEYRCLRPFEDSIRDDNQTGKQEQRFKTEVAGDLTTGERSEEVSHELGRLIVTEDPSGRIGWCMFTKQCLDRWHQGRCRKSDAHPQDDQLTRIRDERLRNQESGKD